MPAKVAQVVWNLKIPIIVHLEYETCSLAMLGMTSKDLVSRTSLVTLRMMHEPLPPLSLSCHQPWTQSPF